MPNSYFSIKNHHLLLNHTITLRVVDKFTFCFGQWFADGIPHKGFASRVFNTADLLYIYTLCPEFRDATRRALNAYGEGFNAIFRDGCLDRWLFTSPKQAQQIADRWLDEYNGERPHCGLGMLTPNEFEKRFHHQQAC